MIHVIAIITTHPGQRATVLEAFRANVPAVLAEVGCIEYAAAVDLADGPAFQAQCGTDCFMVVEKWENLDSLKAHSAAPHMVAYGARTRDMVASRAIHILQPA
jgi:quinol monooxygenase YgiN